MALYQNSYSQDNVYGKALGLIERGLAPSVESDGEQIHLDLGCGYAAIAEPLVAATGLTYVGADLDEEALTDVRSRGLEAHSLRFADEQETLARLREIINGRKVRSVTFLDTLEHLLDSAGALNAIHAVVQEHNAILVLSVPNVSHRDVGFKLAFGAWDYTSAGIIDHTHTRYFTAENLRRQLQHSGLFPVAMDNVLMGESDQHFPRTHPALASGTTLNLFLTGLREGAAPDAITNQFVWLCAAGPASGGVAYVEEREEPRPFLSVVMRTQGTRIASLTEALTCLAGQTDQDFEVHIVGHRLSLTNQVAVERAIEDTPRSLRSRIRLVKVDHGNRVTPLKVGFAAARGEYIAILDDDDIPFAHWVQTYRAMANRAPGKMLRARSVVQDVRNVSVNNHGAIKHVSGMDTRYLVDFDFFDHLVGNESPNVAVAFPRGVIQDFGFTFDEALTTTEDWDLIMRTAAVVGVESSTEIISIYHWWREDDSSRTAHPKEEWESNYHRILTKMDRQPILLPPGSAPLIRSMVQRIRQHENEQTDLTTQIEYWESISDQSKIHIRNVEAMATIARTELATARKSLATVAEESRVHARNLAAQTTHEAAAREEAERRLSLTSEAASILDSFSWRVTGPARIPGRLLRNTRPVRMGDLFGLDNEQLEQVVSALRTSRSWRMTTPLRGRSTRSR